MINKLVLLHLVYPFFLLFSLFNFKEFDIIILKDIYTSL